jgi:hypothetical protein
VRLRGAWCGNSRHLGSLNLCQARVPSAVRGFVVNVFFLYLVLPRFWGSAVSEFTTFNVVLVLPMVLLLVASLVAYRLEGRDFQWSRFRDRFRLNSMSWQTWLWAIALAIFMYGGPYALPLSFAIASAAAIADHITPFQRLKWLAGILGFMLANWVVWQCGSLFARIPLHAEPVYPERKQQ